MVVRIILFLIFAYFGIKTFLWLSRYFRRSLDRRTQGSPEQTGTINDMVRDPVCGVYIPYQGALSLVRNGENVYFCSEECRREFVNDPR
ncbi:MAG: YHS domain-containing protein [Desulfomonile sp.]|nr:YHS domain-containing protein [Deltaproteobacteria bacterium]